MQVGGIGHNHDSSSHQVTNCMHTHAAKREGAAASPSTGMQNVTVQQATTTQPEGQFSLSAWLDKTWGGAKKLWGSIWGGNVVATDGQVGTQSGEAQVLAQVGDRNVSDSMGTNVATRQEQQPDLTQNVSTPQIAAAATAVQQSPSVQNNPYFSAVGDVGRQEETVWQRVKVRFKDVAGKLMGHLPGRFTSFFAQSSFQTKQERPKEDLRRRSKYRKDEVEIDCMLSDVSHLQDSYNKKGEYSKLAGEVQSNISVRK